MLASEMGGGGAGGEEGLAVLSHYFTSAALDNIHFIALHNRVALLFTDWVAFWQSESNPRDMWILRHCNILYGILCYHDMVLQGHCKLIYAINSVCLCISKSCTLSVKHTIVVTQEWLLIVLIGLLRSGVGVSSAVECCGRVLPASALHSQACYWPRRPGGDQSSQSGGSSGDARSMRAASQPEIASHC